MALAATVVWEVRSAGVDTNGGGFDPKVVAPGTDFSQQNAAQIAFADLVIGNPTTTQLTSAAHPFGATHPGNIINITGGTGFTPGRYEILSVSGVIATMDRSVGVAGSTGGTGNLGGALATPGQACASMVAGNTVYVLAPGTYTVSASLAVAGGGIQMPAGSSAVAPCIMVGYTSSRTILNTDSPPTIAMGANNAAGANLNANFNVIRNFLFTNTTFTGTTGVIAGASNQLVERCQANGLARGFGIGTGAAGPVGIHVINCYAFNCSVVGFQVFASMGAHSFIQCTADTCGSIGNTFAGFLFGSNNAICIQCIAINNSGPGFDQNTSNVTGGLFIACTAYGNVGASGNGFVTGTGIMILVNSVSFGNGTNDIRDNLDTSPNYLNRIIGCATKVFTTASFSTNSNIISLATLTVNPFTNAGGKDFSLNSQAGGGLACQGFGFPKMFLGIPTASFWDAGAVQHKVP